jgi:hypothetical protein
MFIGLGYHSFLFCGIADFREPGGDNDAEFDPFIGALFDAVKTIFGRNHQAGNINLAFYLGQVLIDLETQDFSALGIDRIDFTLIPGKGDIFHKFVAYLAFITGGSDNGYTPWFE